jgi:hypothetical protein
LITFFNTSGEGGVGTTGTGGTSPIEPRHRFFSWILLLGWYIYDRQKSSILNNFQVMFLCDRSPSSDIFSPSYIRQNLEISPKIVKRIAKAERELNDIIHQYIPRQELVAKFIIEHTGVRDFIKNFLRNILILVSSKYDYTEHHMGIRGLILMVAMHLERNTSETIHAVKQLWDEARPDFIQLIMTLYGEHMRASRDSHGDSSPLFLDDNPHVVSGEIAPSMWQALKNVIT